MSKRVNEAAVKLRYGPEWFVRSLRLRKTNIIGVIIPNILNYFFQIWYKVLKSISGGKIRMRYYDYLLKTNYLVQHILLKQQI